MMASVSKFSIKIPKKSISLPCRSHPTTLEIEQLLSKIKTTVAEASTAETICSSLSQLARLYNCMNNLLNSSTTQVLMSYSQTKKWVNELVDESVRFLDICGSISDMLSEVKDHITDLLCALRRRNCNNLITGSCIMKYNCLRKKMRKNFKRLSSSFKQQVDNFSGGRSVVVDSDNHQRAAVIRAVIGVSKMTIMVFESLFAFFSVSVSKPNRLSIVVSKLMHKDMAACEDQKENGSLNDLQSTDAALRILCKYGLISDNGNVQIAQCRLERVGALIDRMEGGLECIFGFLIQTRVSLLNILSQ